MIQNASNTPSSGSATPASGQNTDLNSLPIEGDESGKPGDQVAYETHRKLLGEKKRAQQELEATRARVAEFERKEREREEAELKKNNDYQKLVELKEAELKAAQSQVETYKQSIQNAKKLDAFLKSVQGTVGQEYWQLIDTDAILINPETGEVDMGSAAKAASEFRAKYPRVIETRQGIGLPQGAPQGNNAGVPTYDEWLKMSAADQKKHFKAVRQAEEAKGQMI